MTDSEALTEARALTIVMDIARTTAMKHRDEGRRVLADQIDAALSALGTAPAVGVKGLEWRDMIMAEGSKLRRLMAEGPFNVFHIDEREDGQWQLFTGYFGSAADGCMKLYPTLDAAKVAGQEIQERLIRSALVASPAPAAEIRADDAPAWFDACWKISGTGMSKVQFLDKYQQHLGVSKEVADRMRRALSEGSASGK